MRRSVLIAAASMLFGCADPRAARQAELATWVGRPEVALVQAMGAPSRTYETAGMKFLTYEDPRFEVVPGAPIYLEPGPFWYGGGFPPTAINLACDTTFTVSGGVVRAYSLRGNACG